MMTQVAITYQPWEWKLQMQLIFRLPAFQNNLLLPPVLWLEELARSSTMLKRFDFDRFFFILLETLIYGVVTYYYRYILLL